MKTDTQTPFFAREALGFRPFFLLASYSTVFSMALWGGFYAHQRSAGTIFADLHYHMHEMVFGFAFAVIAGFLLTAVTNWTGEKTLAGKQLIIPALLWLTARILPFYCDSIELIAIIDLSLIPYLAIPIAKALMKSENKRNYFVLAILAALELCHLGFYLDLLGHTPGWARISLLTAINIITMLIIIISGRIMPFFTNKGMDTKTSEKEPWLEKVCIASCALLFLETQLYSVPKLAAGLFFIAALAHSYRLVLWYQKSVWKKPILMVLYLAYSWLIIAFLAKGLSLLGIISGHTSLHALTVGFIGGYCLAMMARVSLGHTGREIKSSWSCNLSFFILHCAAIIRVFAPLIHPENYKEAIMLSSTLWLVAFFFFSVGFTRIWLRPRADNKVG